MSKPTIIVEGRWYRMTWPKRFGLRHTLPCILRVENITRDYTGCPWAEFVLPTAFVEAVPTYEFRRYASPPYRTRREAIAGRED